MKTFSCPKCGWRRHQDGRRRGNRPGYLLIGAGTSFSAIAFTHSLHGNWINQGSFVAGSSTVQLLGGLDTAITGASTFNTLTLNKSSSNNVVTLNNSAGVTTLNMTSGKMLTGPNSVTITSTRNGPGIILGNRGGRQIAERGR